VAETWGTCMRIGTVWSFWNFDRITKIFNIQSAMSEVTVISDLQVVTAKGSR
jgi:hypothetical protein